MNEYETLARQLLAEIGVIADPVSVQRASAFLCNNIARPVTEEGFRYRVSIWVPENGHGNWLEWARCTSDTKADCVGECLATRLTGVQIARCVNGTFVPYRYVPEAARAF